MEKLRVEDVALSFVDQSRVVPLMVDVAGLTLGLSARLESGPAGVAGRAEDLGLTLARVALRGGAAASAPVISLEQISVDGGRIDLGARQVAMSQVVVKGGSTTVVRDADQNLGVVGQKRPARGGALSHPQ